jgi:hypothetical protein
MSKTRLIRVDESFYKKISSLKEITSIVNGTKMLSYLIDDDIQTIKKIMKKKERYFVEYLKF